MKLIDELNKAHTFLSVQLSAIFGMLALGFEYLPMAKEYLPADWYKYAFFVILLSRLIKQKKASE
jgi:hypothetical protein